MNQPQRSNCNADGLATAVAEITGLPFKQNADALAKWAFECTVNRKDVYGTYTPPSERGKIISTGPRKGQPIGKAITEHKPLTFSRLQKHFQCEAPEYNIGPHALSTSDTCRWTAWDLDAHDDTPHRNFEDAILIFNLLVQLGFSPILIPSDEKGGYHVWVIFSRPVDSAAAFYFARTLLADAKVTSKKIDVYPKQKRLSPPDVKYGNWLRLPGRHHTRGFICDRVWNGFEWCHGQEAIDFILIHKGDDPSCIPPAPEPTPAPITQTDYSSDISAPDKLKRAQKYMAKLDPSISGQHGHDRLLHAACTARKFDLDDSFAMTLLREFNAGCQPPWSDHDIERKLSEAKKKVTGSDIGILLRKNRKDFKPPADEPILSALQRKAKSSASNEVVTEDQPIESEPATMSQVDQPPAEPTDAPPAEKKPFSPDPKFVIEFPQPLPMADHFLDTNYFDHEGRYTLRRYQQTWWTHQQGYRELSDESLTAEIYNHLDKLWTPERDPKNNSIIADSFIKIIPRSSSVNEVQKALPSRGLIVTGEMPQWLDSRQNPQPCNVVAFKNGLLDTADFRVNGPRLIPNTSAWFSGDACPYKFDENARCPIWLETLGQIFEDDPESIELLQEWFGILLVPDNRYEKLMLLNGPPRSGKGTTISAINYMLGDEQIATTSFTKLASRFGLHPMIGKLAAIMPDAHIGKKDGTAALEVLKSITGGDKQAIDRKGVDELPQVKMISRFTIAVNELPRLPDDAGALKPRLLLLHYKKSFAGQENTSLKASLAQEAPGIANWALEGLCRLREQGSFTIPESSKKIMKVFDRIVSPVLGFIDECCELDPNTYIEKKTLYAAWTVWCKDVGDEPGNRASFGQQLVNAVPLITSGRRGPRGEQFTVYEGVKLVQR